MKEKLILAAVAAMTACALSAEVIRLEAERFENLGGWTVESQYHQKLGSSYLQAHGLGRPVADASTTFSVTGGTYRVWVRTRNWTGKWRPDALGAGRFYLVVDGETLPMLLGVQGKGEWQWVCADAVNLAAGKHTVALKDVCGFDARVDGIVFTTEKSWLSGEHLAKAKVIGEGEGGAFKGDLVVVGGGVAGICTAISAARLGMKVALVQDRPVLGGNNSSEVRVHLGGWANVPPYERLGDVVTEIGPAKGGNAESAANYEDGRKLAAVKDEKNISLYLNTRVEAAERNGARIVAVTGVDVVTGAKTRFAAPLFADCTGDGNLGQLVSAWFMQGREGKERWKEPNAPEKGDKLTMGASVQWNTRSIPASVTFPEEPWMLDFDDKSARPGVKGDWDWETGMGRDQVSDAEEIRDYGLLVVYSNWSFVKNRSSKKTGYRDRVLNWVAQVAGKRESRRLQGDYILTENDLVNRTEQPDGTCATTWTIDLHYPRGEEETHFKGDSFISESRNQVIWPYAIPYRCLYSKNIPNLFMAGRNISVSHIALGTTRLMRTCGMMGEVVGMAASLCKANGCDPCGVYEKHLDGLKALMTKGVGKGGKNPPQTYNNQSSLDKDLSVKNMRATWGRTTVRPTVKDHEAYVKGQPPEKRLAHFEDVLANAGTWELDEKDSFALHLKCLGLAHETYRHEKVVEHYEAIKAMKPDYKGDDVFRARYRAHYNAVQDAKKFPLDEKDINFGQTLKSMGVEEKKTVHLKDYWNPTNVTAAFQKLIDDPEVTTIVLDKTETPWYITSVKFLHNVTGKRVLIKKGATVLRCPFALRHCVDAKKDGPGAMFSFSSCQNVILESDGEDPKDTLIGYYKTGDERRKTTKREGSSGVSVSHEYGQRPTRNIVIRNLSISNCECDGIGLGPLWDPCEEIFVENVLLDSNYRQGCSPCAYYSLYFKNVTFSNTGGGEPMAGLDVEPWEDYLATCNLYLFDCTFKNNRGGGFLLATTTHEAVLVQAKRCKFLETGPNAQVSVITLPVNYINRNACPLSDVRFEECLFESRGSTICFNPCPMYNMTLKDCVIRDVRTEAQKKWAKRAPTPIKVNMSRDFGVTDLPEGCRPTYRFDNVRIEGFEGAEPLGVADEMGKMNVGHLFHGVVDWNGKPFDLGTVSYKGPDIDEPKTAFADLKALLPPAKKLAEDEAMPESNCKLIFGGAWWLKHPIHSYYFWAEKGRKVSFDFQLTHDYEWIKLPTAMVHVVDASGKTNDLAVVTKGTTNLVYTAKTTGWHRFTPGLALDPKSTIGSGIYYYVTNVKGANFAWQADTTSDCFAKFTLKDSQQPYTAYFEVPAGGKECRIRANYGGFILKDPAGNVVDEIGSDDYLGRHVFTIRPSSDKAEIWSLTTPAGAKGGYTRALRFYAPLSGIWADSPEALPCRFAEHFVPAKKSAGESAAVKVVLDKTGLSADVLAKLEAAKAARKAFAAKKEHAAAKKALEDQIAKMRAAGMSDGVQHQINDLSRAVKLQGRLAVMEEKAAAESPEVFEVAAFCQALLGTIDAAELKPMGLDVADGVLEYDDPAKLMKLVERLRK